MHTKVSRRSFLSSATVAAAIAGTNPSVASFNQPSPQSKAQIAITFDLEMSRKYPKPDMLEWDYQKGNLNEATKQYSLNAARIVKDRGQLMHFFCVGRVLEQKDVSWLRSIAALGHPVGNHTYDHVNVWATDAAKTQFRFQRSPWLIEGKSAEEIIRENIRITTAAMKQRVGIQADGFRTPGGSSAALNGRQDIQQLLLDEGFTWVSSKYPPHLSSKPGEAPTEEVFSSIVNAHAQAQPYIYPTGLIEIPMSPISDVGAFRTSKWSLEHFLKSVRQSVEWAIENNGVFDLLCHPSIMYVEDPEFRTVRLVCDLVERAESSAEIVGLSTIAKATKSAAQKLR